MKTRPCAARPKPNGPAATPAPPDSLHRGLVVSHLGKGLAVESAEGEIIACHTRRRLGNAAVGDRVLWEPCQGGGRVMEILPRRSLLTRPALGGKTRPVAANLDRILVVFSIRPECDFLLIDQYLVVCEHREIKAELLFNKIDLTVGAERETMEKQLSVYREIGYPVHLVSAKTGEGMEALRRHLKGHTTMLAGQSGVGKSSLTNVLIPDMALRIGALSEGTGHGRHTTTTSTLYHLPNGGDLIDSPGVAIFGLADISERELAEGFREFRAYLPRCRFNDCRHLHDKGCAVREAVDEGVIRKERYKRFLKLREKLPTAAG